ncbi:membrane alanyl aminopeptidase-like [Aphomia sociella]
MSKYLLTALWLVLVAYARGDSDFPLWEIEEIPTRALATRNDEHIYRLPESVEPIAYDIYLDLYFAERTDRPFSYDGRVYITITAVEDNVTQIVLHANVDSINSIDLHTIDGTSFPLVAQSPFVIEPQYHFLRINLAQPLVNGDNYTLFIDYTSTMNEGPMKRGIWRGWYTDENDELRIYATTHFQPYNARQAFPCWDEPLYKAVFKLHISRPLSYSATFSNTGVETFQVSDDRVLENFRATPKMSTYLVTFLVSETFKVIAEDDTFNPSVRIIGRSNTAGLGDHALKLSVGMTKFFNEYFDIPYESLHENLLNDHISSPDWASAGTENWGMVSYRELYLIIDPRETIMSVEHYATTLVSHELAHKWFGNLVTCFWWSNTWINEGFASYFGYIAAHEVFPEYELNEHFNSRYLQTSLSSDSGVNSPPLNYDVNTPSQVTGHFGTISYSKAAAFLRMTVNIITPETFQKACNYFLDNNRFEPVDQYDLYDAFAQAIEEDGSLSEYAQFNFTDYYRIWVNEPGYPILNVDINHSSGVMSLSQERFFLSSTATPTGQIYPIPITYSTKSNLRFEELKPVYMMSSATASLEKPAGEEWVIFNNLQHAHYRVNYDDRTWDLIAEALSNDPETIHYLNRAQIADDVFALMRSGRITHGKGFSILKFLRHEDNYHVWTVAISGYTWLRNRLRHLPDAQATFDSFILSYMENVIETVGFEPSSNEGPTTSLTRQEVLQFACNLGHKRCNEESIQRFNSMKNNNWVDPRIRRNVYMTGIRDGTSDDFEFLLQRFKDSNYANDQLEILRGLAATKNSQLLTQYLDLTLEREIRSHDKANSFNYALLGNQENADTVLQFVKNNIDAIREAYIEDSPANPVQTVLSNLASYLDEAELVDYENWLRTTQSSSRQFATTINAISTARANMAWGTDNVDIILGAARDDATTVVTSILMLMGMLLLTMVV